MSPLRRLWNVVRRSRLDDDLRQELDTHLALIEDEERAQGSSLEQARQKARSRFGNPLTYRERALDAVMAAWLDTVCQDVRFAIRQLRKAPGFTAVAVLSLALGIGANGAIFTLIDAVLMKTLPVRDPGGLVMLGDARSSGVGTRPHGSFPVYSHELYQYLRDANMLDGLCAFQSADAQVSVRRTGSSAAGPAR